MRNDDETFEVQQLRAMQQPSWNEGRLDDLNRKVDRGIERLDDERGSLRLEIRRGFERVDERFEAVNREFRAVRNEMKEGFDKVDARFDRIDERFDRQTRFLLGAALAIVVALIGAPHL